MLIILWILLGLLALLLLLLLIPVSVAADYRDGGLTAYARYGILKVKIFPRKAKAEKKRGVKKKPRKEAVEERIDSAALMKRLKAVWALLKATPSGLRIIRKGLTVPRLVILLSVGGEDAHKAAENYGRTAAVFYPALRVLCGTVNVKDPVVYMAPNFISGETVCEVSLRARILPITVLAAGIAIVARYIKSISEGRRKHIHKVDKGGISNESAANGSAASAQ
jgi:hypothetical protein